MSLLRRRAMMESGRRILYPIPDGTYSQYSALWYTVNNGTMHLVDGNARFSASSPTTEYRVDSMNQQSWIISPEDMVRVEIDNLANLSWYFRTNENSNMPINQYFSDAGRIAGKTFKNLFAIGTAKEGDVNLKVYVNGERWI